MTRTFVKLALALSLIFTSAGGVVAMAGDTLTMPPMYSAKLAFEQIQLNQLDDPAQIAARHLNLAQNRFQELMQLVQGGQIPDEAIQNRMNAHYNLAFRWAAQLDDPDLLDFLARAEEQLQAQIRNCTRTQIHIAGSTGVSLSNMIQMLNQFRTQAQDSIGDPATFRWQYQHQSQPNDVPSCEGCDPVGDQNRYGPQPDHPGPGEPGGNPDCTNCDPVGDQHQYGPQPDQPGPGQPGGNPDCTNCDPTGDQNQNGQGGNQRGSGRP